MNDVIIIGTGPAAITAGIYARRSNLDVLIIGLDESALMKAKQIDNYYGMPRISGMSLYQAGINQIKDLGVKIVNEEVLTINRNFQEPPQFKIKTSNKEYDTKTIILATGMVRTMPRIANIFDYKDKNISFCAICDSFFYRNKRVCVIGYNDYALEEAKELLKVTPQVTILTNGQVPLFKSDDRIVVINDKIDKFIGDDYLSSIKFGTKTINVDGLFIAWGTPGGMEFSKKLGLEMENNCVVTNKWMQTNIPGIFACGDMTGAPYQIHKATYEGMMAALGVSKFLKN